MNPAEKLAMFFFTTIILMVFSFFGNALVLHLMKTWSMCNG